MTHADPVHKVSIVSRGRAAGYTLKLPLEDRHLYSKKHFLAELAGARGGYASEEVGFNELTTGASNDIERATVIARKMVMEWGMSDKIGPIHLSSSADSSTVFLGRDYARNAKHSDDYAILVDEVVKRVIDNAFNKGQSILKKYTKELDTIAAQLLEKETLTGSEINDIVYGKKGSPKGHFVKKENNTPTSGKTITKDHETKSKKKQIVPKLGVQPA